MGYYDFDDHFWAPHQVCKQKSQTIDQEEYFSEYFSIMGKLYNWLRGFKCSSINALEKAYEKKWILSTARLASLLNLTSKTLIGHKSFENYGFTFTRSRQVGSEIGWRVGKVDSD